MNVAVVTDDMETISPHFGRATHYLVYQIEGGSVKKKEVRDKPSHGPHIEDGVHHHEGGPETAATHDAMLAGIRDCEVVISRGMGGPMYASLQNAGMKVYITNLQSAEDAVRALVAGTLDNHREMLH